jgi:hypothetical protein
MLLENWTKFLLFWLYYVDSIHALFYLAHELLGLPEFGLMLRSKWVVLPLAFDERVNEFLWYWYSINNLHQNICCFRPINSLFCI